MVRGMPGEMITITKHPGAAAPVHCWGVRLCDDSRLLQPCALPTHLYTWRIRHGTCAWKASDNQASSKINQQNHLWSLFFIAIEAWLTWINDWLVPFTMNQDEKLLIPYYTGKLSFHHCGPLITINHSQIATQNPGNESGHSPLTAVPSCSRFASGWPPTTLPLVPWSWTDQHSSQGTLLGFTAMNWPCCLTETTLRNIYSAKPCLAPLLWPMLVQHPQGDAQNARTEKWQKWPNMEWFAGSLVAGCW